MILSAEHLDKGFGGNTVLTDITAKIEDNDRIGLVGVNGAGKSTLLKLFTGRELPDAGSIALSNQVTVGFLEQNSGLEGSNTIWQEMLRVFAPVLAMEKELRELEQQMARLDMERDGQSYEELSHRYARLDEQFSKADGYLIEVKIKTILNGMGFSEKPADTVIATLSGGEKTRLALAKLLLEQPQLLILDEPTNHLDFKTLTWLEEYLLSYKGALLIVSHDRYFLDKLVTAVWDLERGRLICYKGNYTKYQALKKERMARLQKEYEIQQQEIASLEDFVARNLVRASTTKRAQSRQAALERMEKIEKPGGDLKSAHLRFEYDREPVKDVLAIRDLTLAVGSGKDRRELASHIELAVERGSKVAVIGANGIGKSTFLKTILWLIPPGGGDFIWGKNVKTAYYEQEIKNLHPELTALEEIWHRYPSMTENRVRSILGGVLLSGDAVYKKVGVLSGGEKAKLNFALLMLQRGNVLVLDEPTNHLDLASKEELEEALMEFTGTIIMVSHDRYMLNRVPDKIVEFLSEHVVEYKGNYDDYLAQKEKMQPPAPPVQKPARPEPSAAQKAYRSRQQKSEENRLRQELRRLENDIAAYEETVAALEKEITLPEVCGDYKLVAEKCAVLDETRTLLSASYDRWASLSDEING
ncbi:MAG: ABC-F family ATP-binding cassette domain-containing protein [Oscillospiraceae bacterium]|nr:ABC-F family ATP-binding cassette domain-containing protein [Oscillospiraceae bacterium]